MLSSAALFWWVDDKTIWRNACPYFLVLFVYFSTIVMSCFQSCDTQFQVFLVYWIHMEICEPDLPERVYIVKILWYLVSAPFILYLCPWSCRGYSSACSFDSSRMWLYQVSSGLFTWGPRPTQPWSVPPVMELLPTTPVHSTLQPSKTNQRRDSGLELGEEKENSWAFIWKNTFKVQINFILEIFLKWCLILIIK